jgi:hypothetical protein
MAIFVGCKKQQVVDPELAKLPKATKTGANTCGCLVNGKAWVMEQGSAENIGVTSWFKIGGPDSSVLAFTLRGYHPSLEIGKTLNIHNGFGGSDFYINRMRYGSNSPNGFQNASTGNIMFTHVDEKNKIVSGTFDFNYKGETSNIPDQVLSNCRFDFKLLY